MVALNAKVTTHAGTIDRLLLVSNEANVDVKAANALQNAQRDVEPAGAGVCNLFIMNGDVLSTVARQKLGNKPMKCVSGLR